MGTAPRNPAHEMNNLARQLNARNGDKQMNTLSGRATSIRTAVTAKPGPMTSGKSVG